MQVWMWITYGKGESDKRYPIIIGHSTVKNSVHTKVDKLYKPQVPNYTWDIRIDIPIFFSQTEAI